MYELIEMISSSAPHYHEAEVRVNIHVLLCTCYKVYYNYYMLYMCICTCIHVHLHVTKPLLVRECDSCKLHVHVNYRFTVITTMYSTCITH